MTSDAGPQEVLRVLSPGIRCIYVDRGRQHCQHMGLTESGPMDEYSYLWANRLLGNPLSSATLEIAMGLVRVEALTNCLVAICGADFTARVNSRAVGNWCSFKLSKGDLLAFKGPQRRGMIAYLAISGSFHCPKVFSSHCTVEREQLGGPNHGKKLTKGEIIFANQLPHQPTSSLQRSISSDLIPDYSNHQAIMIRFVPGYQWNRLEKTQQKQFLNASYGVTEQSDRMGIRLQGAILGPPLQGILSEGIALGAIQMPPDGNPIVLMRDRQTIGGYPKLGTVLSTDIEKLAQAMPGQRITFTPSSIDVAYQERMRRELFFGA